MTPYFYECLHCGLPAFNLIEMPEAGSRIESRIAEHLNGQPIGPMTPFRCDSCGRSITEGGSWPFIPGTLRTHRVKVRAP